LDEFSFAGGRQAALAHARFPATQWEITATRCSSF
jgi:hypothetical protein